MDPRVKPEDDEKPVIPAKAGIQMSMDSKPMDPRVKPEDDEKPVIPAKAGIHMKL
jgi:hypothetical protein